MIREVVRFASMGVEDLTRLALLGRLTGPLCWVALEGAQKYLTAIARGDIAPRSVRTARAKTCGLCPQRQDKPYLSVGAVGGACSVCLCRVTITVRGRIHPAGKTWVESEECPEKRWGPVESSVCVGGGVAPGASGAVDLPTHRIAAPPPDGGG